MESRYTVTHPGEARLSAGSLRPETNRNIEYVYAVLTLMATTHAQSWSGDYISLISTLLIRIQKELTQDHALLISDLMRAASEFIEYVRAPSSAKPAGASIAPLDEGGYTTYARDAITLYDAYFSSEPVSKGIHLIQLIHSFLSIHRVFRLVTEPVYKTITDPATYKTDKQLEGGILGALANLGITPSEFQRVLREQTSDWVYKISTKGGPNGKAIFTARADAIAMFTNSSVMKAFTALAEHMKMGSLVNDMLSCVDLPDFVSPREDDYKLGRLHTIEEWGGKMRVVAIVDYWTQTLLDPIHQTVNYFLRGLQADGTFDQTAVAEIVKARTRDISGKVYSFDLSAATDRLPVIFQESILATLFGNTNPALNWKRILIDRDYHPEFGKPLRYAVGQPMGAKSSFPMLALSHHVVVQLAAKQAGLKGRFTGYVIIGDDISIFDPSVALAYQSIIAKLGVSINLAKSVIHTAGYLPAGELAKRLFLNGYEVSAIPVKLIAKMATAPIHVSTLQDHLLERGAFKDTKSTLIMLTGTVDPETGRRLLALNALPSSVTGMKHPHGPLVETLSVGAMYPERPVTTPDLEEAYLYTAVVEQVKRLDALINETGVIQGIVEMKANTRLAASYDSKGLTYLTDVMSAKSAVLPTLKASHPFVKAVAAETSRVSSLLATLRGGTTSIASMAKAELLDRFRNAIADVFDPFTRDDSPIPSFTIMNKALVSLDTLILDKEGKKLEFSVLVKSLSRHYSVVWIRGVGVYVNTVKSKVEQSYGVLESLAVLSAKAMYLSPRKDRSLGARIRVTDKADKAKGVLVNPKLEVTDQ